MSLRPLAAAPSTHRSLPCRAVLPLLLLLLLLLLQKSRSNPRVKPTSPCERWWGVCEPARTSHIRVKIRVQTVWISDTAAAFLRSGAARRSSSFCASNGSACLCKRIAIYFSAFLRSVAMIPIESALESRARRKTSERTHVHISPSRPSCQTGAVVSTRVVRLSLRCSEVVLEDLDILNGVASSLSKRHTAATG
jgi:hypothetical protein